MPKAHPIWTKEWISTATLNVANGSHGNTLTEVDSPFIFIDKETLNSFRRHILYWYNKINLLIVPKAWPLRTKFQKSSCRKQYSRKGSHGNTLPEVSCKRYLPSKFVPKICHVILIGIRAEGTKYAINIKLYMFWQSDFFGPFRQTKFFRLMELSHLILKYEEKSLVK